MPLTDNKLYDLLDAIELVLPSETAMEGDKIGLQVECNSYITGVLFTLELTEEVLEECLKLNFNTIVSFHPLIYKPLPEISLADRVGKLTSHLIKNSINFISVHTTFDSHIMGTSRILADLLMLETIGFLSPDKNSSNKNSGMGVICESKIPISELDLLNKVRNVCKAPIRFASNKNKSTVSKIAIVGGSGTSFLGDVIDKKCDAFITADITYHTFHSIKNKILLIDAGHYEMEQFVPAGIANLLNNYLVEHNINHAISKCITNPISYF